MIGQSQLMRDIKKDVEGDVVMDSADGSSSANDERTPTVSKGSTPSITSGSGGGFFAAPNSSFNFTSPLASSSMSTGNGSDSTPSALFRRRSGAPTSIPNFPSARDHRSGGGTPTGDLTPSPSTSPKSPFRTPKSPNTPPHTLRSGQSGNIGGGISGPPVPMSFFAAASGASSSMTGPQSPWQFLAETSGAPTPSLLGPGRGSPHLGGPFERLNIGSSWSGGNLWASTDGSNGAVRRASLEPPSNAQSAMGSPPRVGSSPNISSETLARYRAMAGKASASGLKIKGEQQEDTASAKPPLPAALAKRRASLPKSLIDSLSPPSTNTRITKSPSPLISEASSESSPVPPPKLKPILPSELIPLLSKSSTLVLDVRPPSSFQSSHIPSAHSLPVPSTLLRRPAFNLARLIGMLSPTSMEAVSKWKEKKDIILLDAESSTTPDGSILEGLAGKFHREGYDGAIWFIRGGHAAAEAAEIHLMNDDQVDPVGNETELSGQSAGPAGQLSSGRLGRLAFQSGSTGSQGQARQSPTNDLNGPSTPGFHFRLNPFDKPSSRSMSIEANTNEGARPVPKASTRGFQSGSELSLISNNSSGSNNSASMMKKKKVQPANPFFDNIRQNLELSHGGITERIPLHLPQEVKRRAHEFPAWLAELVEMNDADGAERLAMEFYQVELGEQKRLQAVMDWHSKDSGTVIRSYDQQERKAHLVEQIRRDEDDLGRLGAGDSNDENYFPFSITAGVERGSKNRYKNIWPYDFSRVKLDNPGDGDTDYINASFVQPRSTSRRYIATQGPLDATYRDFWTLIWEQDVRVIVMITKQYEGGSIKCGNYWEESNYGPFTLRQTEHIGGEDKVHQANTGFDFGMAAKSSTSETALLENIKRVFLLSNKNHPDSQPRKIIQLQCIAWPDFDVPETPDVLLSLIKDTDNAMTEARPDEDDRANCPPVLVHCSAGVGRTGSFIIVDAMIDALRREYNESHQNEWKDINRDPRIPTIPGIDYLSDRSERHSGSPPSRSDSRKSGSPDNLSGSEENLSASQSGSRHGSRGTRKSVSFKDSPRPSNYQAMTEGFPFSSSPTPASMTSTSDVTQPMTSNDGSSSGGNTTEKEPDYNRKQAMVVDSPIPRTNFATLGSRGALRDERYNKYRSQSAFSEVSSEGGFGDPIRRPSLASVFTSSETLSSEAIALPHPKAITKSAERHRTPSPISELTNPIMSTLQGMRVQRMSLVQTLRQYVFVHRAIIHNYLAMIDEEYERDTSKEFTIETSPSSGESGNRSKESTSTGEDDIHIKRRASPTELQNERSPKKPEGPDALMSHSSGGQASSDLERRASVKRMRSTMAQELSGSLGGTIDAGSDHGSAGSGAGSAAGRRRGSKFGHL